MTPRVIAWAFYDFANTVFAMNILTLYFPLWVTVDQGGSQLAYSAALSVSILTAALIGPWVGQISDRLGRRLPFLAAFTAICAGFTAVLSQVHTLLAALFVFSLANIGYQLGSMFYDTLLPEVSRRQHMGRVSGFGVALGYVGTYAALLSSQPFVAQGGRHAAFLPTALLFALFSIPCLVFSPEPARGPQRAGAWLGLRESVGRLRTIVQEYPSAATYLVASFFILLSVNTLIVFMAIYAKKLLGFGDSELFRLFLFATAFAMASALAAGQAVDRWGAYRFLRTVVLVWTIAALGATFVLGKASLWILGPIVGMCMGATWVGARVLLIELAPPAQLGEFFGLYGLIGRAASIVGPLLWGAVTWALREQGGFALRAAVGVLFVSLAVGYWQFRRIPRAALAKSPPRRV